MSFSIKCDKCGHVVKFVKSAKRHNVKVDIPILIYTRIERKSGVDWLVMECTACGQEQEEI